MSAVGIYQARVISPFANGSCVVVIPQLFGDVQVPITRFMGSTLPLSPTMGWVMFEGGDENRPVWMNTDTSKVSDDWYVTQAEAAATYLTPAQADASFLTPAEGDALFLTQAEGDTRYLASDPVALAANQTFLSAMPLGNRNLFDNGAFSIAQRGFTTATVYSTSGVWSQDRWNGVVDFGSWKIDAWTGGVVLPGFYNTPYVMALAAATPAAGNVSLFSQSLEGQDVQHLLWGTAQAKPLTFSGWYYTGVVGTYYVEIQNLVNNRCASVPIVVTAGTANTWQHVVATFPGNTFDILPNTNAAVLRFNFWLSGGTNFTSGVWSPAWTLTAANRAPGQVNLASVINQAVVFAGFQLEVGSVATPFDYRRSADDLQRCLRYYQRFGGQTTYEVLMPSGFNFTTGTNNVAYRQATVPMRAIPILSSSTTASSFRLTNGSSAVVASALPAIESSCSSQTLVVLWATVSGYPAGTALVVQANNDLNAWIAFSAEI